VILRILRGLRDRLRAKLTPQVQDDAQEHVDRYLAKLRAEFKKKRLINPTTGRLDIRFNPLAMDEEINCPCHYGGPPSRCLIHKEQSDPSEELAFLEWLKERTGDVPKNNVLRNDDKWRKLDLNYNPMENDEDFFIPQRDVA
jgi:hypothetical protein